MDKNGALHYAEILLEKLERFETVASGTKIHDTRVYQAVLLGWKRAVEEGKIPNALRDLNVGIQEAESFLSQNARK